MGQPRGFERVYQMLKKFLEEHGFKVKRGAWLDVYKDNILWCDLQVGHWAFHRPPRRGAKYTILYMFCEGRVKPEARQWLKGYDYVLVPTKWLKKHLEELDVHAEVMRMGIDTEFFKPIPMYKWIDVLYIAIWESSWDNRKFLHKVYEVSFPYSTYIHSRVTIPYEMLPYIYNSAKVYLSLTACEGCNVPCIEANACGVPVVANAEPSTREYAYGVLIDPVKVYDIEDRGIIFTFHEPNFQKLKEELHKLLKDHARLHNMSIEARQFALQFDYRKTYRLLLEILTK